jgi:phenylacetate-CoA ligase
MKIRLECCHGMDSAYKPELAKQVAERMKNEIMVSPIVEIVDYCTLPRSERKSKRIFDNRPL